MGWDFRSHALYLSQWGYHSFCAYVTYSALTGVSVRTFGCLAGGVLICMVVMLLEVRVRRLYKANCSLLRDRCSLLRGRSKVVQKAKCSCFGGDCCCRARGSSGMGKVVQVCTSAREENGAS